MTDIDLIEQVLAEHVVAPHITTNGRKWCSCGMVVEGRTSLAGWTRRHQAEMIATALVIAEQEPANAREGL